MELLNTANTLQIKMQQNSVIIDLFSNNLGQSVQNRYSRIFGRFDHLSEQGRNEAVTVVSIRWLHSMSISQFSRSIFFFLWWVWSFILLVFIGFKRFFTRKNLQFWRSKVIFQIKLRQRGTMSYLGQYQQLFWQFCLFLLSEILLLTSRWLHCHSTWCLPNNFFRILESAVTTFSNHLE